MQEPDESKATTTHAFLCNRTLRLLSTFRTLRNLHIKLKQVFPLLSLFLNNHQISHSSSKPHFIPIITKTKRHPLRFIFNQPLWYCKIGSSKLFGYLEEKIETKDNHSLKDLLLKLSNTIPETTRRFLRVSELKTEDVLKILLGSQFEYKKFEVEVEKVKSLWGIFKWGTSAQGKGFKHLPKSFELMAKMLV